MLRNKSKYSAHWSMKELAKNTSPRHVDVNPLHKKRSISTAAPAVRLPSSPAKISGQAAGGGKIPNIKNADYTTTTP